LPDVFAILNSEPRFVVVDGVEMQLRRPTVGDLAEALHVNTTAPQDANAHLLLRHLQTRNGSAVFATLEHARTCPLKLALRVVPMIEELYAEGRD
jgi:hypothetical protein